MGRLLRASVASFALIALLLGCSGLDEPKRQEGPLFDAEYYRVNAANYFDAEQWERARQQFERALELEPTNWSARLGVAACDLYEGRRRFASGDPRGARNLLARADARILELWDGSVGVDTQAEPDADIQQWRAALLHAETRRTLAELDLFEADEAVRRINDLSPSDPRRPEIESRTKALRAGAEKRLAEARDVFAQLAAMRNAAPDAILAHAELRQASGDVAAAEVEFLRFLEIAEASRQAILAAQTEIDATYSTDAAREIARAGLGTKERTNAQKQVIVLDRLAELHFQRARQTPDRDRRAGQIARAVRHLERARTLAPDELRLLVRLAQCEGEIGLFDSAFDRLDTYFRESARRGRDFGAELNEAYDLRNELERRKRLAGS